MTQRGIQVPRLSARQARWLVVAVNTVAQTGTAFHVTVGYRGDPPGGSGLAFPFTGAVIAFWLAVSLPVMRGERPRHGPWLLAGMVAVVVVGTFCLASPAFHGAAWLGRFFWVSAVQTVAATALLVLPRPWSIVVFVVPALMSIRYDFGTQPTWLMGFYYSWYSLVAHPIMAGQLYGLTHFVRVLDEVERARMELAGVAVDRERLRISRDLHDSLGQSLSAISLKGDLAIRLLPLDAGRARTEIGELIDIARTALRDLRRIPRGAHRVSLGTELDGAAVLLAAAGVEARIDVDLPPLSDETEQAIAWTVREGVTNLLRHSEASTARITGARADGGIRLEIHNDGAAEPAPDGNGLAGLRHRAAALAGALVTRRAPDGSFHLTLELPEEAS